MQLTTLEKYLRFPKLPETNFHAGVFYEQNKQYSPAFSFYLRSAELAEEGGMEDDVSRSIAYEGLCRAFICLNYYNKRDTTCEALLSYAISLSPDRPEAYYLLSKFHAKKKNWMQVYTLSSIGFNLGVEDFHSISDLQYRSQDSFLFSMAIASYELGRTTESRRILQELADNQDHLSESEVKDLERYLKHLGVGRAYVGDVPYVKAKDFYGFKFEFEGLSTIERNYSQTYQDMFVLSVLNGLRRGSYLEIGSGDPTYNSNTNLLEKEFGWRGISIDIKDTEVNKFNSQRKNKAVCADATKVNYEKILSGFGEVIDYLQIDTEPSSTSFETLLSVPFDKYKFRVITFEHDHALDITRKYREKSRRYLSSLGYKLIVPDVGPTDWYSFEDWWVEPNLVDIEKLEKMGMVLDPHDNGANPIKEYFVSHVSEKLLSLPSVNFISLEESTDRRNNLLSQFEGYGVENFTPHIYKRRHEYNDYEVIFTEGFNSNKFDTGCTTSHLNTIRNWYEKTTEAYTIICEDDLSLETVKYWKFTWSEFFNSLPNDWKCVQLVLISETEHKNFSFKKRGPYDWCTAAYLISRDHAKTLLDKFCDRTNRNKFIIDTGDKPPTSEAVIFNHEGVYIFPLFVEEVYGLSSTREDAEDYDPCTGQGGNHMESHRAVVDWWRYNTTDQKLNFRSKAK